MVLAKGNARVKINVKRSVFIASAKECKSVSEAKEFIKSVSKEFGDATHNCWAYRVYEDGKIVEHSSDAGEPSGSAGLPILGAIKSLDLVNIAVVVTRYFGGVKLGIRGLIDAYSQAAMSVLRQLEFTHAEEVYLYKLKLPISEYGKVLSKLSRQAKILSENFTQDSFEIIYASKTPIIEDATRIKKTLMEKES